MRRTLLLLVAVLVATACSGGGGAPPDRPKREDLVAQVAGFDIAADIEARFLVGLLTRTNEFVSGGQVDMRFFYLGDPSTDEFYREATGTFLAVPGEETAHEHPEGGPASEGRGVYAVEAISFDRPGPWEVRVTADVEGEELTGTAAFQVNEKPLVPIPGDPAPRTDNLTVGSKAPPGAIDSRAESGGKVPDAELHQTTIADAIRAGHPALVVFATPVYCQSRFCGPVTEMVADLQKKYGDRAEFIHVEIWRDFQNQVINRAAAEWLFRGQNLNEPWVFLIGADGVIEARWDNVATPGEIEPLLRDLPPLR